MKNLLVAIAVSAALLLAGCANKAAPVDTTKAPVAKKKCCGKKGVKKVKTAKYNK